MKQALIVAFLGVVRDRYTQLGQPASIREKLEIASAIPGIRGIEIIYPDECYEPSAVLEALEDTGLEVAAVNVNVKGSESFHRGSLSTEDARTRSSAVSLVIQAKEFAQRVGATRVTCAPLADGFDYPLQQAYCPAWKRMVESLRIAMEEGVPMPVHLEHKPSDPRVHGILSTSDLVLHLLSAIGSSHGGITFNIGHASVDGCSPAFALANVLASRVPLYLHICDANDAWDWDLLPGATHYYQLLEVLSEVQASGYDGWLTSDSFPLRHGSLEFCTAHAERTSAAWQTAASLRSDKTLNNEVLCWSEVKQWLSLTR